MSQPHLHLAADLAGHRDAGIGVLAEGLYAFQIDQYLRAAPGDLKDEADLVYLLGHLAGSLGLRGAKLRCQRKSARHVVHKNILRPLLRTMRLHRNRETR
ncbi:MAG: hypothetical protein LKM31_07745 [Sphingobium sp.]|nr:hypothetical protein [Sphingobium sp.]